MTPTTSAMIERALELGEKATKGPWRHVPSDNVIDGPFAHRLFEWQARSIDVPVVERDANSALVAESRTLLPILARALRVAVEALRDARHGGKAETALARIEALCKGEA